MRLVFMGFSASLILNNKSSLDAEVVLKMEHPGQAFEARHCHDVCHFVISCVFCPVIHHCRRFHDTHDGYFHANECINCFGVGVDAASIELTVE